MIKSFLNPKGHQNPTSGSKVTAILLKGWIWPIGEASAGKGLRLQPAQQACFHPYLRSVKAQFPVTALTHPFPQDLHNIITPNPLELKS